MEALDKTQSHVTQLYALLYQLHVHVHAYRTFNLLDTFILHESYYEYF